MARLKKEIQDLIAYYYNLKSVMKESTVFGTGRNMQIRVTPIRASQSFEMLDDLERFDDTAADIFLEKERTRVAQQIFTIAQDIVFRQGLQEEIEEWEQRRTLETHWEKISWGQRILMKLDLIDPYDKMNLSPVEKDGVAIGFKRKTDQSDEDTKEQQIDAIFNDIDMQRPEE